MHEPRFHIALVHPEIPPNAGNIGRISVGLGCTMHLVHPLGFSTSLKAVRRAGLDHWKHVDVREHADLDAFLLWCGSRTRYLFSSHGGQRFNRAPFQRGDVLIFGRESVGLPPWFVELEGAWRIPIPARGRSLNLANAVSIVAYAALQAIEPELF